MKKKLLTAALLTVAAAVLVIASVLGTIAYLTANSGVSNVFTIGDVEIKMFETKVNEEGQFDASGDEVETNTYHLVPGKKYDKNPTIRILSEFENDKMYLFVKSSNQIRSIEAGYSTDPTENETLTMREQMEANGWVEFVQSENKIDIVWVYGTRDPQTGIITPTEVDPTSTQMRGNTEGPVGEFLLCESFTIAKEADVSLYGVAKVNFTAFAIQTSGVSDTEKAWEAIKATYPYEGGIINPVNPYNGDKENPYAPVPDSQVPTDPDDSTNTENSNTETSDSNA